MQCYQRRHPDSLPATAECLLSCNVDDRVQLREDGSRPTVRRRSSATSTAAGTGLNGAVCSRSAGSWRKLRRPRDLRQFRDEYADLPPSADTQQRGAPATTLDDNISTTLEQLRLIQDDDCCVVRCFNTTANGLVNRGDSFKRRNESLLHSSSSDMVHGAAPRSRSQSSSNSHASYVHQLAAATDADLDDADDTEGVQQATVPVVQSSSYTVLVLGQQGVGRTALLQQFMTSQFMAAETAIGIFTLYILT